MSLPTKVLYLLELLGAVLTCVESRTYPLEKGLEQDSSNTTQDWEISIDWELYQINGGNYFGICYFFMPGSYSSCGCFSKNVCSLYGWHCNLSLVHPKHMIWLCPAILSFGDKAILWIRFWCWEHFELCRLICAFELSTGSLEVNLS